MVDINGSYTDYASQKRKLAEKYVRVQDEWIEACMQWLSSEAEVIVISLAIKLPRMEVGFFCKTKSEN